ncbi:MAG: AAA family ATPase [Acidobacteria bacterium]|nr:AAA family ATPase [Acidobacteriota bacterium]
MIFLDCHIRGFGKLRDCKLRFEPGINLVFAANEGGKSTLQQFLVGLLYGQLRSDLKVQRRMDPWVEKYQPWYGQEYGGMLRCRLADGRELEIRRSFGQDENRIEIRTSTGEDITRQYEIGRNGEVLFGRFHLGLPKELYESVGIVRENRASDIHSRETIRDRIANLAHSGDEELSIRKRIARLEEALDSVGSDRAPTKPYKQAKDLVRDLQSEQKELLERRARFEEWLQERNRLAAEAGRMNRELSRTRHALLGARRRDVESRIESLEDIDREICTLRETVESLGARAEFPADDLEELNQLVGARDSIARRLEEVRNEKEEALLRLALAESERRELEAYAPLSESEEAEKITEWFVGYLGLSLQTEGLKKTSDRLLGEARDLEKRLNRLCPALGEPGADWQNFAREAAEEEQAASRECALLAEDAAREGSKMAAALRTAFNRRFAAVIALLAAAGPFLWRHLAGSEAWSVWFDSVFGALCLSFSTGMWFAAAKAAGMGRDARRKIRELELEQERIREEGGRKRRKLDETVENSGYRGLNDFLADAKKSEQDRRKLEDARSRLQETRLGIEERRKQSEETYRQLKGSLEKVGLPCSPGNLKFQIDVLRSKLRKFRELDAGYGRCKHRVDSLKAEEAALDMEFGRKLDRVRSLLEQAEVGSPEEFREQCLKSRKSVELAQKMESRCREFKRLAQGRTLRQWKEALEAMQSQRQDHPAPETEADEGEPEAEAESGMPYLPYPPAVAELEEKERVLASRLSDVRQEHARSVERVNGAFQNCRLLSEIEEDLALAETKFGELERNRAALGTALETIEKLYRQQQEVLAPQLNAAVEQRFLRLSGRRYGEVKIDPDFQVWVRESETGELRSADRLSRGTQDQLYFSIRFGILDLVSDEAESCPCLLDEPFAAYDRPRLLEAYNILSGESGRRQLLLFTCREDLLDLAGRNNARIIRPDSKE